MTSALGFQKPGWCLTCVLSSPACNGLLRFTPVVTPADLFVVSMVAKLLQSMYLHTSIGGARVQDRAYGYITALSYFTWLTHKLLIKLLCPQSNQHTMQTFFTSSLKYENANITNFVLAVPFQLKKDQVCKLQMWPLSPTDI